MDNSILSPAVIVSLSNFLVYGPSGFAALMLVLFTIGLYVRNVSPARERLLKKFLITGAVCFSIAVGAQFIPKPELGGTHTLHLAVMPLDLGRIQSLPMPIINVNGTKLSERAPRTYAVAKETTAIVDVTDAINFVQEYRSQSERQRQAMSNVVSGADVLVAQLQRTTQLIDRSCSGGRNGVSPAIAPEIIAINTSVANSISSTKAALSAAVAEVPPSTDN